MKKQDIPIWLWVVGFIVLAPLLIIIELANPFKKKRRR